MWRLVLSLLLLSAVALADGDAEEDIYEYSEEEIEERAFLVVQKKVLEAQVSDGTNITVVLTLHNAGTRAAGKVRVVDPALPKTVELLSKDATDTPIDKLSPGLTLTYRTVLRPKATGQLVLEPTTVKYAPAVGSIEEQVTFSTVPAVMVLTTNEYIVSKILVMGSYVTLGILNTRAEWNRFGLMAAVVVLLFALNYVWQKLSEARKERLRRKATEYIEKSK